MSTSDSTSGEAGRARRRATTATKSAAASKSAPATKALPATKAPASAGTKRVRARRQPADDGALAHAPTAAPVEPGGNGEWERRVAEAAYFLAERRGFKGGSPEQDWFEAERELRALESTTF